MKVYREVSLSGLFGFKFWSGAVDTVKYLTDEELDIIESELEALHPDGISETELNDLFWFDCDYIAQMLGCENFEELMKNRQG